MQLFVDTLAIPQPSNWPAGVSWSSNQYPVIARALDGQQAGIRRDNFTRPPTVLVLDESAVVPGTGTNNLPLIDVLYNATGVTDAYGLERFYVRADGSIWQRAGWAPTPRTYTPNPAADTQMNPVRSAEKAAFEDNLQTALARLDTILTTPPANLAGLYVYAQDLARVQKRLLQLLNRLFRPDS